MGFILATSKENYLKKINTCRQLQSLIVYPTSMVDKCQLMGMAFILVKASDMQPPHQFSATTNGTNLVCSFSIQQCVTYMYYSYLLPVSQVWVICVPWSRTQFFYTVMQDKILKITILTYLFCMLLFAPHGRGGLFNVHIIPLEIKLYEACTFNQLLLLKGASQLSCCFAVSKFFKCL